jgi:hypothetical protein
MIRQLLHSMSKRQLSISHMKTKPTLKPHEIAEAEEKELTDWGTVQKKDTGFDDVEPSKDGYDNYWAKQLSSGEDYKNTVYKKK